jgi:RNA polymerase sigma-70 factor (ECF subfamily)
MQREGEFSDLLEKAKGGDSHAFDSLAGRFTDRLSWFIRSRLGDRLSRKVEADDLVQETVAAAWRSISEFRGRGEEAFWSWLATIARHAVQSEARKHGAKKRAAEGQQSLHDLVRTEGGGAKELLELLTRSSTSPSEALRRDERFERLKRTLDTLSPEHREVIILARVQKLRTGEIAEKLGKTPDAVSALLYRALLKLRAAFGNTDSMSLPDRSLEEEGYGET